MDVMHQLYSKKDIKEKVRLLARQINTYYPSTDRLVLFGVLKGCHPFLSDLMRHLDPSAEVEYISASSYKGGTESGDLILSVTQEVKQKDFSDAHILLVEDIVDTGQTVEAIRNRLEMLFLPVSIKVCSLLFKPGSLQIEESKPDFVGWIVDSFIVGYGLDYQEKYRGLPSISRLEQFNV